MTPASPSDPPVRAVDVGGTLVGVADAGSGPIVVAVHGLPGSHRDFRWLGAALEPHARLVRIDMPGFGITPGGLGRSLAARADFVVDVLDTLELERPAILGHSMGGPVAAAVAARHPGRVCALGLVASVGRREHRAFRAWPVPPWALSLVLRVPGARSRVLPKLRVGFQRMGFKVDDAAILETVHQVGAMSFSAHRAHLEALRVPTLVAWAADDAHIEESISEDLYWACPSGPRLRFAEGGHNLQKTRAIELTEALVAWLA